jgi:tripartite-type tricarboxylate transporter receptor subunit TctC
MSQKSSAPPTRVRTGLDMTHVPYRGGGPVLADLLAGTIQLGFMNLPTVIPSAGR